MGSFTDALKNPKPYLRVNDSGKLVVDRAELVKDEAFKKTVKDARTVGSSRPLGSSNQK